MKCVIFVNLRYLKINHSNEFITLNNIFKISFCTICTYLKFFEKLCQGVNQFQKNLLYNEAIYKSNLLQHITQKLLRRTI